MNLSKAAKQALTLYETLILLLPLFYDCVMAFNKTLTSLMYRLSDLYFDSVEARLVAQRSGLDVSDIAFTGNVRNYWQNILYYADIIMDEGASNHNSIIGLLETITSPDERGKKDEFLKSVLNNFKKGITTIDKGPSADDNWQKSENLDQLERLMGSVSTLQPISFLEQGLVCAHAVARVIIGNTLGTGFLVANNYFITNNHVIPDKDIADRVKVQFNYQQNWLGNDLQYECFNLDPKKGFFTSTDNKVTELLDFTIVKIAGDANAAYGQLRFSQQAALKNDFVSIIQHPAGGPKQIALYHNVVTFANDSVVQYLTDTLPGSSGSPVFNDKWQVVALHHSGGWLKEPGLSKSVYRNEGINGLRLQEVLNHLIA
jgi:V8-like Glu-specific endopeptidase